MPQLRGQLTYRIKEASRESLLGYEISQVELRFMAYVLYVMMNEQNLDPRRVNEEERGIFQRWKKLGFVEGGMSELRITKEFWDILTEMVFLGYVDIGEHVVAEEPTLYLYLGDMHIGSLHSEEDVMLKMTDWEEVYDASRTPYYKRSSYCVVDLETHRLIEAEDEQSRSN